MTNQEGGVIVDDQVAIREFIDAIFAVCTIPGHWMELFLSRDDIHGNPGKLFEARLHMGLNISKNIGFVAKNNVYTVRLRENC